MTTSQSYYYYYYFIAILCSCGNNIHFLEIIQESAFPLEEGEEGY